jgi:glycosyl transferase family 2/uncharacterized protein DUF3473
VGGLRVAISGGNYVRQFPHALLSRAVARRSREDADPVVFYFMPWELDRHQPKIQGISRLQRIRHYRNLAKTRWVLDDYLRRYGFQGIADYLGIPLEAPAPSALAPTPEVLPEVAADGGQREAVTLVVPMFNEAQNVHYLARTLVAFRRELESAYHVHLVLVDDGSTDDTWALLQSHFADLPDCALLRHEKNRGVAAAILTGIRAAPTEIVCSIDCDCSYDPRELIAMIPQVTNGLGVDLEVKNGGFLGVAETLIALKLRGGRIVEHPATLESRLLGESKMKIVRTILSHLTLLEQLALRGDSGAATGAADDRAPHGRPEPPGP